MDYTLENTRPVRLDKKLYKQLKELAEKEKRYFTFLVNKAVENYLKAKKVVASGKQQ